MMGIVNYALVVLTVLLVNIIQLTVT
eukprot:UN06197